ncbi:MAG TPA: glutathione peroxidase [Acidimicrobiales bacterium]|nr:glutathione peroxidase [Acidimicrobiales bacterium]
MTTIANFSATTITGDDQPLADYDGKVLLVVNTASKCGFTPQYAGLQKLHEDLGSDAFEVLGFPCDQFAHQEPGDNDEIAEFCDTTYHVTFPMFAKIDVNGSDAHPLYAWLRSQKSGVLANRIKWNFTKFLIGRDGKVIRRYGPATKPEKITGYIESAIDAG